jgi:hypothetical protein
VKLTISGLARAEACPASTFLPRVEESSIWAEQGRAIHEFLCNAALLGRDEALSKVPVKYIEVCEVLDLERLPHGSPDAYAFEVAYAWNYETDTARELGRNTGLRDYSGGGPTEICGTADLLGVTSDTVVVLDIKSGWAELGPPKTAAQLQGYAVAAARAYGKEKAIVGWIRLRDGQPYYEQATLDMLELDAAAARLKDIVDACLSEELLSAGAMDQVVPRAGAHCKYCPVLRRCPAHAELVRPFLLPEGATPAPLVLDEVTAPLLYERAVAVEQVLKLVYASIDLFAEAHPFTFANGDRYGKVGTAREKIDPLVAKSAFTPAALADDALPVPEVKLPLTPEQWAVIWDEATEIKHELTKAALKRSLKKRLPPGAKITHLEREVLARLREVKAAGTETYYSVKRFKPKNDPRLEGAEPVALEETTNP